jgi:glycosyltransferase A (GT-A) superfamily protein (DUF2064 family)
VKTRLAQNLPASAVIDLYCCLLEDTLSLAKSLDGVEIAIMCPACDVDDLSRAVGERVHVLAQVGEGLAAGLVSVFTHFCTAERRRTIALNSDSPHLPSSVLQTAFDALASCDLVVGPTHDGGYYLVGAKASYPGLFTGSGMGTANALEELLACAGTLGLSVLFTDPFYDIDVAADLSRLADELRLAPHRAPRTAAWLLEWHAEVVGHRSRSSGT